MSQQKLNRINALHRLSGEEYYNQFTHISFDIQLSQWKDLLQYQRILNKALQPSQKDNKQCPRTRAQTVSILKQLVKLQKQDHINARDFQKSIGQFKKKVKSKKQRPPAKKSIFSTICQLFMPQKKINQQKSISKQKKVDKKDSIQKNPYDNDENSDVKSFQKEQFQGLLSQIQLQQKTLFKNLKSRINPVKISLTQTKTNLNKLI